MKIEIKPKLTKKSAKVVCEIDEVRKGGRNDGEVDGQTDCVAGALRKRCVWEGHRRDPPSKAPEVWRGVVIQKKTQRRNRSSIHSIVIRTSCRCDREGGVRNIVRRLVERVTRE